jgi:hypothetical protein
MENLKTSIQRDGFCAPILVRPLEQNLYEVISGNHRFMASQELGIKNVPCVVANLSDKAAKRLAVNLNTIHGQPNPELLAPFLADFEIPDLKDIFLEVDMKNELLEWDNTLAEMLNKMEPPQSMNHDSPQHKTVCCKCQKCGTIHVIKEKENNV